MNTITAGTATGLLYRMPAGTQKALRGGLVGASLALVYCGVTNFGRMKEMAKSITGK